MTGKALFDPGLQPERTALAWRRTSLALAVGSVVSFRLLLPILDSWAIGAGLTGLVLTAVTWVSAGRRAHRTRGVLLGSAGRLPDGGLALFLTVIVTSFGAFGLLYTVLR